jgi:undecaprenyl-diphosphatase
MIIHHDILDVYNLRLRFDKKWREIFTALISAGLGWFMAEVIKNAVQSPRPFEAIDGINNLFPEVGYAFPSQHATFFTALAFAIYLQHKKAGYFFLFLALAIGVARVVAGVHYPIDILGGIVLGILVAYIVHHIKFAKEGNRV